MRSVTSSASFSPWLGTVASRMPSRHSTWPICRRQDGLSPDLELFKKAERLWKEVASREPKNAMVDGRARRHSATAGRGAGGSRPARRGRRTGSANRSTPAAANLSCSTSLAIDYARNAGLTGKLPTRLNPDSFDERRRRLKSAPSPCSARRRPTDSRTPLACEANRLSSRSVPALISRQSWRTLSFPRSPRIAVPRG